MYLRLAWRNLWRNRRRTVLATASVFFAVLFSLAMRSMQHGSYDFMIASAVGQSLGYLQVHGEGFWEKRSLDRSMREDTAVSARIAAVPGVTALASRFETFALLSRDSATRIAEITGVDPARERAMTGLAKRLVAGRYFSAGARSALLGSALAEALGVRPGDSIVVYGQGYHGVTAAARVPVAGILRFPVPQMDRALAFLPLRYAQWLFGATDRVTSVAVMVRAGSDLEDVRRRVRAIAGSGTETMTWQEMAPELEQAIAVDSAGGILMLGILYIVIGFGIFGTVMMMTAERRREFGILVSVGMARGKLMAVTTVETLLVAFIGAAAGVAAGIPLLWYMHLHPIPLTGELRDAMLAYGLEPIMPFSVAPGIFEAQTAIVLGIGALCALYPALVVRTLRPLEAFRA